MASRQLDHFLGIIVDRQEIASDVFDLREEFFVVELIMRVEARARSFTVFAGGIRGIEKENGSLWGDVLTISIPPLLRGAPLFASRNFAAAVELRW